MKKIIFLLTLLAVFDARSQQDPVYSQYFFNQFVVNPAYAGSRNSTSAVLLHRTRWTGIDGAPTTQTISVHSKSKESTLAWGFNAARDQLGANTNIQALATGAYHLALKKGKLSFGLRGGVYNSQINGENLEFSDPTDPLNVGTRQSTVVPSIDFGLYYYTRRFYVGLSLNHINTPNFNFNELESSTYGLRSFNTLGTGYAFDVNDNLMIRPSLLFSASPTVSPNLDLNVSALIYQKVWLGISVRNQTTLNILTEVNVTDYMRIGYAFDAFVNSLGPFSNGVHEIFIGFDFTTDKSTIISPRYL